MSKIIELRQKAGAALDKWKAALEARDKATTPEDRTAKTNDVEARKADYDLVIAELRDHEALEAAERSEANTGRATPSPSTPEKKASERYSLLRAVRSIVDKKPLDGLEKEMFDEATKEGRTSGVSLSGDIRVPGFMFEAGEKRDLVVGTDSQGGYTVETNLGQMIPLLRPRLATERLGATVLSNLVGNLDIPRQITGTTAAWEGENTAADETNITFDKLTLSPKRLAAFVDVSKQLMVQSNNPSVEGLVRNDMNRSVRQAIDVAFLNGATGGNNPVGLLNTSGIGSVAVGTNGGAPTWAHMISLWKEIASDDADMETLRYLTTPGIAAQLMQTEKASGTAQFVWSSNNAQGSINGYQALTSTNVPSTLTKGTSSDCHAVIFGDWSSMIIGSWAGIDITVDPYTRAKEAIVVLTINSWWDMVIRHAAAFAAIKDARVTI